MRYLAIIFLFVSVSCIGQTDTIENRESGRSARTKINETILKANDHTDSITALRSSITINENAISNIASSSADSLGYINVMDYGAVGNGVTDDRTAIDVAVDSAMANNIPVYFPPGTYYISGNMSPHLVGDLEMYGTPHSIIKSDIETGTVFQARGVTGSDDSPDYDILKNVDYVVDASMALTADTGSIIQIISTDWWGNQASFVKGEIIKVQRISNDTMYLFSPTFDSYDRTTTVLNKFDGYSVRIHDLKFDAVALDYWYTNNTIIRDCDFYNIRAAVGINCYRSYNSLITNNNVSRDKYTGHFYGIDINSSTHTTVSYNRLSLHDQALISGGSYPVRHILFDNNYVANGTGAGQIDFHPNLEYGQITNNFIIGEQHGIYAKGLNVSIRNNEVVLLADSQIGITKAEESISDTANANFHTCDYIEITGNKVYDGIDTIENTYGIRLNWEGWYDTISFINVSDNFCKVGLYGFAQGESQAPYKNHVNKFLISDNYFEVEGVTSVGVHEITSEAWTCDEMLVTNNTIIGSDNIGFYMKMQTDSGVYEVDKLILRGNTIESGGNYSILVQGVKYLICEGNTFTGGYAYSSNSSYTIFRENYFIDVTAGNKIILADYVNNSIVDHNIYVGGASENNTLKANTTEINY